MKDERLGVEMEPSEFSEMVEARRPVFVKLAGDVTEVGWLELGLRSVRSRFCGTGLRLTRWCGEVPDASVASSRGLAGRASEGGEAEVTVV